MQLDEAKRFGGPELMRNLHYASGKIHKLHQVYGVSGALSTPFRMVPVSTSEL